MTVVQTVSLLVAAAAGTVTVLTRDTLHQALVFGLYGLTLALVFLVFHAPDVALAQVVISGVILPLLLLVALAKVRGADR